MKLIKVEAEGFKSFADRTVLTFDGGVVGIVGPNGSGKSNINDAIKWVLGEASAKSLRGDTMEDVIFAGSKTVKAMNKAEVSLTFDNSDGTSSIPNKKIVITRVLKRGSGNNEYYINGEPARLKDIREIAMETGMSKSSLAIISQGTVQDIAQATPEQRRGIFEEAAGISKYKSRRLEAMRKLDRTTESLDKIRAIVNELEKQLRPLERQAKKAKIYLKKYDELKDVEISLIVHNMDFYKEKLDELNEELENVISTKEDLNERIANAENNIEARTQHKLSLENEVQEIQSRLHTITDKLHSLEMRTGKDHARRNMIINGQVAGSKKEREVALLEELEEVRAKLHQYEVWDEESTKKIEEAKEKVSEKESKASLLRADNETLRSKLMKTEAQVMILKSNRDNKSNLFKGTRIILENAKSFPGLKGTVADLIKTKKKYNTAIETVLQNALQHLVVSDSDVAVRAVNFLKNNKTGRATFIPLESIKGKEIAPEHLNVISAQPGFISIASDLIETDSQYEVLKKFLLGNIIVVKTIENANALSSILQKRYMVVTLNGDIIRVGGVITGGNKAPSKDLLGLDEKIEKLEELIPDIKANIEENKSKINSITSETSESYAFISELNIESAKVKEKRIITQENFDSLNTQYETLTGKKAKLSKKIKSIDTVESLEAEKSSINALLKAKRESIISINNDLAQMVASKTECEKSLRLIIESSSEKLAEQNKAEYILQQSRQRLSEEYELTIEAAREKYKDSKIDPEKSSEIVSALRREIKELGHVNLDAITAFEEINERYKSMKASEKELFSAQKIILSAIDEMDQIIISKLDATVKLVNTEMNKVFQTMFGGGFAKVQYTDPKDLLNTGIEVVAQPPGKTVKNLKLFSGGEKALVAISLLFAILKAKPLPLSILDEVEAALDDANVIRYANFLQELKDKTQFIVVTHRVGTMARVDHLFGATMQKRGVTSFFSVELSKAKEMVGQ